MGNLCFSLIFENAMHADHAEQKDSSRHDYPPNACSFEPPVRRSGRPTRIWQPACLGIEATRGLGPIRRRVPLPPYPNSYAPKHTVTIQTIFEPQTKNATALIGSCGLAGTRGLAGPSAGRAGDPWAPSPEGEEYQNRIMSGHTSDDAPRAAHPQDADGPSRHSNRQRLPRLLSLALMLDMWVSHVLGRCWT
jgi:hypothetical protein